MPTKGKKQHFLLWKDNYNRIYKVIISYEKRFAIFYDEHDNIIMKRTNVSISALKKLEKEIYKTIHGDDESNSFYFW